MVTSRIGFTATPRVELLERWKHGVTPHQRATSTRPQNRMDVTAGATCRSGSAGHTNVEIEGNEMIVALPGSPGRCSFAAQLCLLLLQVTFILREVNVGLDQLVGGQLARDRMERPDLGYRLNRSTIENTAAGMPCNDDIVRPAVIGAVEADRNYSSRWLLRTQESWVS